MLPLTLDSFRLFLHVLAATVWVGGQLVLAGLVPALRPQGQDTVAAAARRFQLIAWPAFVVLLVTGLWNLDAAHFSRQPDQWQANVLAKIAAFFLAGACAAGHTQIGASVRRIQDPAAARRRSALAGATAGAALLASLLALFWGIQLRA